MVSRLRCSRKELSKVVGNAIEFKKCLLDFTPYFLYEVDLARVQQGGVPPVLDAALTHRPLLSTVTIISTTFQSHLPLSYTTLPPSAGPVKRVYNHILKNRLYINSATTPGHAPGKKGSQQRVANRRHGSRRKERRTTAFPAFRWRMTLTFRDLVHLLEIP